MSTPHNPGNPGAPYAAGPGGQQGHPVAAGAPPVPGRPSDPAAGHGHGAQDAGGYGPGAPFAVSAQQRPFAAYAQVPVDPYALAAAGPLGAPGDPNMPVPRDAAGPSPAAGQNEGSAGPAPTTSAEGGQAAGGVAAHGDDDASSSPPIDYVPGITQDPPQRSTAAPAEVAPGSAPFADAGQDMPRASGHPTPEDDDVDGETVVRVGAAAALEWDDGTGLELDGRVILGRNPAEADGAAVVAVRDETLSLSKTHFEVVVESGIAWLTDRHSTNGVTIVRSGARIVATPGERVQLVPNDVLEMGDRTVTFRGRAG